MHLSCKTGDAALSPLLGSHNPGRLLSHGDHCTAMGTVLQRTLPGSYSCRVITCVPAALLGPPSSAQQRPPPTWLPCALPQMRSPCLHTLVHTFLPVYLMSLTAFACARPNRAALAVANGGGTASHFTVRSIDRSIDGRNHLARTFRQEAGRAIDERLQMFAYTTALRCSE